MKMSAISDIHEQSIDLKNGVIYMYAFNDGGENAGVDHRVADLFLKNLHHMESERPLKEIVVHMHLIGGEWSPGIAIYDAMKESRCKITIKAHGQAESMSSIILQGADKRQVTPHTYFMCHHGSAFHDGDVRNLQKVADWNRCVTEQMCVIYRNCLMNSQWAIDKYGKPTERQIKSFLNKKLNDGDWYLFGGEIVYYGFADEVVT
jgi:ATP-dependent protease ClpP protease subunit